MNILSKPVSLGHPNRPGTKLECVKAVVVHYTANEDPDATDTANAEYFGRGYHIGKDGKFYEADGVTPFRYGSAHILADEDSITAAIPLDEVAWACGDRPLAYTPTYKGQRPAAMHIFGNRQNYQSVSIEICDNGDWDKAVENARDFIVGYIQSLGRTVDVHNSMNPDGAVAPEGDKIYILRHYDVTSKNCPEPFVRAGDAWAALVNEIAEAVK